MMGLPALLTTLWLALGIALLERATPGYQRRHQTISELGSRGAPRELTARYALFLPVGVATGLYGIWWVATGDWPAALLGSSLAIGYLSAALCPADPGSPLGGSMANRLHNLGGMTMYLGGALALLLATGQKPFTLSVAVLLILMTPALAPADPTSYRGHIQRLMEILLFVQFCRFSLG